MTLQTCSFKTDRLLVRPWHDSPDGEWPPVDLPAAVSEMMTDSVTNFLPPDWHGPYSVERANDWIVERDQESPTLLAVDRSNGRPLGLVMIFETPSAVGDLVDLRLGYLLAEAAWGKGLGSELVAGLVRWCRQASQVRSIVGGVGRENQASRRVLERLGFFVTNADSAGQDDELLYELRLDG